MIATLLLTPASAYAFGKEGNGEPVVIDASVVLQGGYDHGDLKRDWPCPDITVGHGDDAHTVEQDRYAGKAVDGGWTIDEYEREIDGVTYWKWITYCYSDEGGVDMSTWEVFWVAVPIPGELVPPLFDQVVKELAAPTPQWQFADEYDWLYVTVPQTLRVTNLAPVTAHASVTNIFGTATATVTGTPMSVTFSTTAPDTPAVTCSIDQLRQPYTPGDGCVITFWHSSSITDSDWFDYTLTVDWQITSEPPRPDLGTTMQTTYTGTIQVAEAQAVVTCQGSSC